MAGRIVINETSGWRYPTFEQLEERIVLDGAVDGISSRTDLFGAQTMDGDPGSDAPLESRADDGAAAELAVVEPLALQTGTDYLPDGTWHYWQRDWNGSNGYEFHAWQDGSSSFHQIQWDSAFNSKYTHNGFDYNLQRDGSWTYETVNWDANENGYSYYATSADTYTYEASQWSGGFGYSYWAEQEPQSTPALAMGNPDWAYKTRVQGENDNEWSEFVQDSSGKHYFVYHFANGHEYLVDSTENIVLAYWLTDVADIEHAVDVGGILQFITNGELWESDGTEKGTVKVSEIPELPDKLPGDNATLYGGVIYGNDGELWSTSGGPHLVKDIKPGPGDSNPYHFIECNGKVYFIANFYELWATDGTEGGTTMVKKFDTQNPFGPFRDGGLWMYFQYDDAVHGVELWRANPYGAEMVQDINPGVGSSWPFSGGYGSEVWCGVDVNGTFFFAATEPEHGLELWRIDAISGDAELVKDIYPGAHGSELGNFFNVNGALLFSANDGEHGYELWRSDGTEAGTVLIKETRPGGVPGSFPFDFRSDGNNLYWRADTKIGTAEHDWQWWKSDGTVQGTKMVNFVSPDVPTTDMSNSIAIDGVIYFMLKDSTDGWELWRSNGTEAGTWTLPWDGKLFDGTETPILKRAGDTLFIYGWNGTQWQLWSFKF